MVAPIPMRWQANGTKLYVANASSDAVAVFALNDASAQPRQPASNFIPTEWYPTALAVHDEELLIATGKGEGTGPNGGWEDESQAPGKAGIPTSRR